jgi:hypothetical protein
MIAFRPRFWSSLFVSFLLRPTGALHGSVRVSSDHAGILRSEIIPTDVVNGNGIGKGTIAVLVKAHDPRSPELHEFESILLPSLHRYVKFQTALTVMYEGDLLLTEAATELLRDHDFIHPLQFVNVTDFFFPTPLETSTLLTGTDVRMRGFGMGYRKMCEFWAAHAHNLPELSQFRYLWRLDTDSQLTSPVSDDVYSVMNTNAAVFGYLLLQDALPEACRGLQNSTEAFYAANPQWAPTSQLAGIFLSSFEARKCPHWNTNFQVMDLDFFRNNRAYNEYTQHLANTLEGFVRYRWGDHIVQTLFLLTQVSPRRTLCMQPWVSGYLHQGASPNCKPDSHEPELCAFRNMSQNAALRSGKHYATVNSAAS